jgi:hypothetical protein
MSSSVIQPGDQRQFFQDSKKEKREDKTKQENIENILHINATKNLTAAIIQVEKFEESSRTQAYEKLYNHVQKNEEPAMLLLQKKIGQLKIPVLNNVKEQVGENCRKIISNIVKGIKEKDYSLSLRVENTLENALLGENMMAIVQELSPDTLEKTLLLIEYSMKLPTISTKFFLIDAFLKELEKRQLLNSEFSMHLWAHTQYIREANGNSPFGACTKSQELFDNAFHTLSKINDKDQFYQHYKKYVMNSDKKKIKEMHNRNSHLLKLVCGFVSSLYKQDAGIAQNLLTSANAITEYDAVGRILSQLHEEMAKSGQLNSFEGFRLFYIVHCKMNRTDFHSKSEEIKGTFEKLQENSPACLRQLFRTEGNFSPIFNKVHNNATLGIKRGKKNIVCFDSEHKRANWGWKITIDQETALLTLTSEKKLMELGIEKNKPYLTPVGKSNKWMVKPVNEDSFKIFSTG